MKRKIHLLLHTKEQRLSQGLTLFRAVSDFPERYIKETIHIWMCAAILISLEHARCRKRITQQN